jgi:hypothetical protein
LGLLVFVECLLVLSESYRHVFPHSLYSCHFLSLNGACLPARHAECKEHVGEVAKVLPTQWKVPIRLCTRRTLNQHIPKQRAKWTKRGPNIEGKHLQTCLQKRVPKKIHFRARTPYWTKICQKQRRKRGAQYRKAKIIKNACRKGGPRNWGLGCARPTYWTKTSSKQRSKKGGQYRKARIFRNAFKKGGNNYRNARIFNNALNEKDGAHELKFRARTPYWTKHVQDQGKKGGPTYKRKNVQTCV